MGAENDLSTDRAPAWLGLRPYILIEIEDVDDQGRPSVNFKTGGGLDPEAAIGLLRYILGELDD